MNNKINRERTLAWRLWRSRTVNTTKEEGRNPEEVGKIHEQEDIDNAFGRYFLIKISVSFVFGNNSDL